MAKINIDAANISAMLDAYAYMDVQSSNYQNMKLSKILIQMKSNGRINKQNEGFYNALVAACKKNPELGNMKLISQSHIDGIGTQSIHGKSCTDDSTPAVAFKDSKGNIYVAYRGTGDGRWPDNGEGFVSPPTTMQKDAAKYLDFVAKNHKGNIYVSGHSKGGNLAMYSSLVSKYKDRINQVYSLDGQGFSRKTINILKNDPSYSDTLKKIYSINGDNDPVHNFIRAIVSKDNTFFVHTHFKDLSLLGIAIPIKDYSYCHDLRGMIKDGEIRWMTDKEGNITNGKEGFFSEYVKKMNQNILLLPEKDQESCAKALMAIAEFVSFPGAVNKYALEGMDGKNANVEDFARFFGVGFPVIIFSYGESVLKELNSKYGIFGSAMFGVFVAGFAPLIKVGMLEVTIISMALHVAQRAIELVEAAIQINTQMTDWANNTFNQITAVINDFMEWCYGVLAGGGASGIDPFILIDTSLMLNYANQLKNVSKRAKQLDRRMNSLYLQLRIDWTSIIKLANLLRTEYLMKYSLRLDSCARALEDTANDFNRVERELTNI